MYIFKVYKFIIIISALASKAGRRGIYLSMDGFLQRSVVMQVHPALMGTSQSRRCGYHIT